MIQKLIFLALAAPALFSCEKNTEKRIVYWPIKYKIRTIYKVNNQGNLNIIDRPYVITYQDDCSTGLTYMSDEAYEKFVNVKKDSIYIYKKFIVNRPGHAAEKSEYDITLY